MRRFALPLVLLLGLLSGCAAPQGASPHLVGANYSGPNLAETDLLFSKTDFTITDLNNTVYIYPGGTTASATTGDALFDLRPYRSAQLLFYLAGLTGGSTPKAGVTCYGYDQPTYPGNGYWTSQATMPTLTGGGAKILFGEIGALATGTGAEGQQATVSYLPMYMHCQLNVSGSPTGLSGIGIHVNIFGRR